MVTRLGTILGTQLGTDLSTFADNPPAPTFDAAKMYGIVEQAATDYYRAAAGGGETGDAAGFGGASLSQLLVLPSNIQLHSRYDNTAFNGFRHWFFTGATLRFSAYNGAGTAVDSPTRTYLASDLGKISLGAFQHTGTQLKNYVDRAEVGSGTAITGYTPAVTTATATSRATLGSTGPGGVSYARMFSWVTWRGVPTLAQVQALFDAVRAAGDIPGKAAVEALMPGTIVTHRWSLKETLAAANVPVVDGQTAPATLTDTVTAASVDDMVRAGTPIVKVIDPTTPKTWSYETTPILYGADGLSAANYYTANAAMGDSNAQAFWIALHFMVEQQSAKTIRVPLGSLNAAANAGFQLRMSTNSTSITLAAADDTNVVRFAPSSTITAADVGKQLLYVGVWDQPALKFRGYFKRAESGTGTTVTGYAPNAGVGPRIGRDYQGTDFSATDVAVFGLAGGLGVPSLAQVQALFDETMATERIGSIAGITTLRVDLTADASANGNALPATLANRASGTITGFAQTGAVTTKPHYARAFGW